MACKLALGEHLCSQLYTHTHTRAISTMWCFNFRRRVDNSPDKSKLVKKNISKSTSNTPTSSTKKNVIKKEPVKSSSTGSNGVLVKVAKVTPMVTMYAVGAVTVALVGLLTAYAIVNGTWTWDKISHKSDLDATDASIAQMKTDVSGLKATTLVQEASMIDIRSSVRDSTTDIERLVFLFVGDGTCKGQSWVDNPNFDIIGSNMFQYELGSDFGASYTRTSADSAGGYNPGVTKPGSITAMTEPMRDGMPMVANYYQPRGIAPQLLRAWDRRHPGSMLIAVNAGAPTGNPSIDGVATPTRYSSVMPNSNYSLYPGMNMFNRATNAAATALASTSVGPSGRVAAIVLCQGWDDRYEDRTKYANAYRDTVVALRDRFNAPVVGIGIHKDVVRLDGNASAIDDIQRGFSDSNNLNFIPRYAYVELPADASDGAQDALANPWHKLDLSIPSLLPFAEYRILPAIEHAQSNQINMKPFPAAENVAISTRTNGIRVLFNQPVEGGRADTWLLEVLSAGAVVASSSASRIQNQYHQYAVDINSVSFVSSDFQYVVGSVYTVRIVASNAQGASPALLLDFVFSNTVLALTTSEDDATITATWEFKPVFIGGSQLEYAICDASTPPVCTVWVPITLDSATRSYTLHAVKSAAVYQFRIAPRNIDFASRGAFCAIATITAATNSLAWPTARWTSGIGTTNIEGTGLYDSGEIATWKDSTGNGHDMQQLSVIPGLSFARPTIRMVPVTDDPILRVSSQPVVNFNLFLSAMCNVDRSASNLHPFNGASDYTKIVVFAHVAADFAGYGDLLSGYGTRTGHNFYGHSHYETHYNASALTSVGEIASVCREIPGSNDYIFPVFYILTTTSTTTNATSGTVSTDTMWSSIELNGKPYTATTAVASLDVTTQAESAWDSAKRALSPMGKPSIPGKSTGALCMGTPLGRTVGVYDTARNAYTSLTDRTLMLSAETYGKVLTRAERDARVASLRKQFKRKFAAPNDCGTP